MKDVISIAENIIWKPIIGYENYYEVSNSGLIKSLPRTYSSKDGIIFRRSGRIMKTRPDSNGKYILVTLRVNNIIKTKLLHRIVAEAFIPNLQNKKFINHIDGNPQNNNSYNLEWCTRSENMLHAYKLGLLVPYERKGFKNPTSKKVVDTASGRYFNSIKEASVYTGLKYGTLKSMLTGPNSNKTTLRICQ